MHSESSFTVYDFDGNLAARYEDGEMVENKDGVTDCQILGVLPDGSEKHSPLFLAPYDLYTVVDDTPDTPMDITMADDELSICVETDADTFQICADDASDIVSCIMTPGVGEDYTITIGCSRSGEPAQTVLTGTGTGMPLSIQMLDGMLNVSGTQDASLSMSAGENNFTIAALAGPGGGIEPSGEVQVSPGEDVAFAITPEEGFAIQAVYVDGEDVGPTESYLFEAVDAPHSISAAFARRLDACTVRVSPDLFTYDGNDHTPSVTVTTPEGDTLEEHRDYELTYANNVEAGMGTVYVQAIHGSGYYGVAEAAFRIANPGNAIESAEYSAIDNSVRLRLLHDDDALAVVAAYDANGAMIAARLANVPEGVYEVQVPLSGVSPDSGWQIKAFLLDGQMKPLCGWKQVGTP